MSVVRKILLWCVVIGLAGCAHRAEPQVKLALAQTERGVMIWLPDHVLFDFGKAELSAQSEPYLRRVAELLRDKTPEPLLLEGHTDNVGAADFNLRLSERRAQAVAVALQDMGVTPQRLRTAGVGLARPLAPNDSELGRRLNRRVELIVLNETVARLTQGEPANAFEDAFARLEAELAPLLSNQGAPAGAGARQ
jgi:flagellar motor protein MotB